MIFHKIKEKLSGTIKIRDPPNEDEIVWNKNYKVKESDFKRNPGGRFSGNDAMTASMKLIDAGVKITSIESDKIHYKITKFKITTIMSKSESWIDPDSKKYRDINQTLHHEQGHFMVEEGFAMKLRKKLEEKIKSEFVCRRVNSEDPRITVEREVKNFLNDLKAQCKEITEAYQKEYDRHAFDERRNLDPKGQKEYDEKIAKMFLDK